MENLWCTEKYDPFATQPYTIMILDKARMKISIIIIVKIIYLVCLKTLSNAF